jgi:hypothetical protein
MKTINMGILFFIFHFSLLTPLKAQMDTTGEKKIIDKYYIKRYNYIFQGKIISSRLGIRIKTSEHVSSNYNFYLVQVLKVIKGDIQKGTIEIVYAAGDRTFYYDDGEIVHGGQGADGPLYQSPPAEGIYFFNKTYGGIFKDSSDVNTNSKSLEFSEGMAVTNGVIDKQYRSELNQYFYKLSDFYAYISANYGVKIEQ